MSINTFYRTCTAHFYNLLMYIIIIQKILEKNKNINVIKKRFLTHDGN